MGKDTIHKQCLGDNVRYADLLNGLLFAGKQEINPADLQELDSPKTGEKERDMVKKVVCGTKFVVVGVENQEKVHYAMPFRNMFYDALEYDRQVRIIRKQVHGIRKKEKEKLLAETADGKTGKILEKDGLAGVGSLTEAEYLSGFRKMDKLIPCITLVLYYGDDWDGPRELVENNPAYQEMDEDAYDMVMAYTNTTELVAKKELYRKGDKLDMCEAIKGMLEDERQEGIEQGRFQAREEAIEIFILDNQEEGISRTRVAEKLVRRFELTVERAEEYLVKYNY